MKLEVLLSTLNFDFSVLDKMNIKTDCIIINQCDENKNIIKDNFKIYNCCERGVSKSRNMALDKAQGDILLFCDDDVIYNDNYEELVLNEFKYNPEADMIFFNLKCDSRKTKYNTKSKKLNFFNILRYGSYNIAIKRDKIGSINFNILFGGNAKYGSGEDTLFIVDAYKNKLKLYSSKYFIGEVKHNKSSWFNGYNEKYFFDKGALFCAINYKFRYLLCLQYLIRHRYTIKNIKFLNAFKLMLAGSHDYIEGNYEKNMENN
jgi:glycosyltransferase involved in cell wall biosynthesis